MLKFDSSEVCKAIAAIKPYGGIFEVRVGVSTKEIWSAYFEDANTCVNALSGLKINKNCNVYITLQELEPSCDSRVQINKFVYNPSTTSDNDVRAYDWFFIDIDPKRASDTSSSKEELDHSYNVAHKIYGFLKTLGFEEPIVACSGNGIHILYNISLKNDEKKENKTLITNCLNALAILFNDDIVKIDTVNSNPSRVCKLYGTEAQKGLDMPERPHRMSCIISKPGVIKNTQKAYLEKLASYFSQKPEKEPYNNYNPVAFDLDEWLSKYGINYRTDAGSNYTKYILDCCPFDSNHKGKDAMLFKFSNGAIAFHCFHNSCADKKWQDVRKLFDPTAYEKKSDYEYNRQFHSYNRNPQKMKPIPQPIVEQEGKKLFLACNDVLDEKEEEATYVKSGIEGIDKKLIGLRKGYVSIWSGLNGSAKSTILSEIMLNAVDDGNTVICYSGELSAKDFFKWVCLQAAGKGNVLPTKFENLYYVPMDKKRKIAKWLANRLLLYNNEYKNDYISISASIEKCIEENKADLVVIDNLMALDISGMGNEKNDAQKDFVLSLERIAKAHNVHIAFVAHPRKTMGFLRKEDISGSANLSDAVDDVFIVHRVNRDFHSRSTNPPDRNPVLSANDRIFTEEATNCLEICKDRNFGTQDYFIPLWFELETKRLKNDKAENVIYGWEREENGEQDDRVINAGFIMTDAEF